MYCLLVSQLCVDLGQPVTYSPLGLLALDASPHYQLLQQVIHSYRTSDTPRTRYKIGLANDNLLVTLIVHLMTIESTEDCRLSPQPSAQDPACNPPYGQGKATTATGGLLEGGSMTA